MSDIIAIPPLFEGENVEELQKQIDKIKEHERQKRNWGNAFQNWSNKHSQDGTTSYGICGYGVICDYCEDNSYGRPCVRALNNWCMAKGKTINYHDRNFEAVWRGEL